MKKPINMKKVLASILALSFAFSIASCGKQEENDPVDAKPPENVSNVENKEKEVEEDNEIEKPEKIRVFGTTIFSSMSDPSSWQPFVDKYYELTGIELEYSKPSHNEYYQQLSLAFTTGDIPDVMEVGTTYYPTYANNGALWDMTSAWGNSDLKASGIVEEKYVNSLKINDVLYGFPMAKGGGTVTYVRQDWLDNLGMKAPTNYDEFTEMLRAFTEDDPDGNGEDDTYGITMPGLVAPETPYTIYQREYYQDAEPGFYQKADGTWVDGMLEPEMLDALKRMKEHYALGYMDTEVATNKTSTCRDKFYSGQVGVFNYWAGQWNVNLENNLTAQTHEGIVMPILPIEEISYIERPSGVLAISSATENPEGIFKYLVEFSHDGGEGELLFTRGVEDVNYKYNSDGIAEALPDPENEKVLYQKSWYNSELGITTFEDPIPLDDRVTESLRILSDNSKITEIPVINDTISEKLPDLIALRDLAIANAVMTDTSVEDVIATYEEDGRALIEAILDSLNN